MRPTEEAEIGLQETYAGWNGRMAEWWDGGMVGWWDRRINIPDLPGCALQRRGKGGGGLIYNAAGGFWSRAMSGEGWAAGKNLISQCDQRQPKLWVPRMGDSGIGRQRQDCVTEK